MAEFTDAQRTILLDPIKPHRVSQDGKGFSHLESFEVKAHLNRLFGFEGWSTHIESLTCIFEEAVTWTPKGGGAPKSGWDVGYLCSMRLELHNDEGWIKSSEDASTGEGTHQPSKGDAHDLAVKSAVSGALKRCATALGDQFGLSLYDHGSMDALVKRVIPYE